MKLSTRIFSESRAKPLIVRNVHRYCSHALGTSHWCAPDGHLLPQPMRALCHQPTPNNSVPLVTYSVHIYSKFVTLTLVILKQHQTYQIILRSNNAKFYCWMMSQARLVLNGGTVKLSSFLLSDSWGENTQRMISVWRCLCAYLWRGYPICARFNLC